MDTDRPSQAQMRGGSLDRRRGSVMEELKRQSTVFFDDPELEQETGDEADGETGTEDETNEEAVEDDMAPYGNGHGPASRTRAKMRQRGQSDENEVIDTAASEEEDALQSSGADDETLGRGRHGTFVG